MSSTINITVNECCGSISGSSGSISGSFETVTIASASLPSSASVLRLDDYGRLEFFLSSSYGVGVVTAIASKRATITQATSQLYIVSGSHHWLEPGALSGAHAVTASVSNAVPREHMSVYVQDTSYLFTIANGGPAAGSIFSSSLGGVNSRCVADLVFDGTNWVLGSITRLV